MPSEPDSLSSDLDPWFYEFVDWAERLLEPPPDDPPLPAQLEPR